MVIGTALGWGNVPTMILAIVLAFFFGYSLTLRGVLKAGVGFSTAVRVALAADTLSIAVMELIDNGVIALWPGAMDAQLSDALFWGALAAALVPAFVITTPVNKWMIGRGSGARGQLGAAVEDPDVVEAEETPFEHALAQAVLAIHPPREVDEELPEGALEELDVPLSALRLLHAVLEKRRPRVHRRVDVAEVPLVGGHLTVGVQKARLQQQVELMLGKVRVDARQRDRVKGEIPGRVPRVLPLVRHRDDVVIEHVEPAVVPDRDRRQ